MWKQIILSSIFLFTALAGCNKTASSPKPEQLIPEEEMVDLLADICKVEARFQRRLSLRGSNNEDLALHNYNLIFAAHEVSVSQFKESYEYYEESPGKMQVLFDSVIVTLTQQEVALRELSSKTDSTHQVNANYYE